MGVDAFTRLQRLFWVVSTQWDELLSFWHSMAVYMVLVFTAVWSKLEGSNRTGPHYLGYRFAVQSDSCRQNWGWCGT
jgi:hypothetical protein